MPADGLVWDGANERHLVVRNRARATRGQALITRAEIDAVYGQARYEPFEHEHVDDRGRLQWQVRLIGPTPAGRFLTVACEVLPDGRYRPITVWESSPGETAAYREAHDDTDN